jgi:hypothetical protein
VLGQPERSHLQRRLVQVLLCEGDTGCRLHDHERHVSAAGGNPGRDHCAFAPAPETDAAAIDVWAAAQESHRRVRIEC